MKRLFLLMTVVTLAAAATATAETGGNTLRPGVTQICLEVDGSTLPVTCHVSGSRAHPEEDICLCAAGARIDAPVCGAGEHAPGEDLALYHARREAARDGTLIGDSYRGAPMCVERPA